MLASFPVPNTMPHWLVGLFPDMRYRTITAAPGSSVVQF